MPDTPMSTKVQEVNTVLSLYMRLLRKTEDTMLWVIASRLSEIEQELEAMEDPHAG